MTSLCLTPEIERALGRVERATPLYPNQDDGIEPLDREKVALAEAVMRAFLAQRSARLERLPARAPVIAASLRLVRGRQRDA